MNDTPEDLTETMLASEWMCQGRLLKARRDTVRLPDGRISTREFILHPGAAVILPVFENGDVLLERQYRYPCGRDFIEVPAGKLDPDEPPEFCAQRELIEETGYRAGSMRFLFEFYPAIGYCNEKMFFFLAQELEHVGHERDHDEFLEILRVPFAEAMDMIRRGEICETKTTTALFWWDKVARGDWQV
ncbi:MAG: NUDIX hydrolase [Pseudomonadota bacterium]